MRGNSPSGIDAGKESDCSRPEGFYARLIKKPLPEFCYFFATFLLKKVPRQANSSQVCLHALAVLKSVWLKRKEGRKRSLRNLHNSDSLTLKS